MNELYIYAIMAAAAIAGGFAFFAALEERQSLELGGEFIDVTGISAYTSGDTIVVTGQVRNPGGASFDSVTVHDIVAGNMRLRQSAATLDGTLAADHGAVTLSWLDRNGTRMEGGPVTPGGAGAAKTNFVKPESDAYNFPGVLPAGTLSRVKIFGLADGPSADPLEGGETRIFRIDVRGLSGGDPGVLDVSRTIPAGSWLYIVMAATEDGNTILSNPVRVKVAFR